MTDEAWDSLISLLIVSWDCGETTFDLCKPEGCSIDLPLRPVYSEVHTDPLDYDAVTLYRKWLHDCTGEHRACPETTKGPLPSRVLDVRAKHLNSDVKLKCTAKEHDDFVALSYCWGGVVPLRTLSTNLQSRQRCIYWQDLPETFQHVVQLARKLDIPYIWIDALCIIQDSADDWAIESAKMAEIYGNAAIVVIAAAAPTPTAGFLGTRNRHLWERIQFGPKTDGRFLMLREVCEHSTDVDPGSKLAVSDRGWCLSGEAHGPANSHFPARRSENGYQSLPVYQNRGGVLPTPHQPTPSAPMKLFEAKSKGYDFWRDAVTEYTQRLMTKATDRLPAISALAKVIQEDTGDEYIAGLWRDDILHGLLWTVHYNSPPKSDTREYVAPSWSWARQPQRRVHYVPVLEQYRKAPFDPGLYCDAELVEYGVTTAHVNKFGAVTSAFLVLRAHYCDVEMSISKSPTTGFVRVAISNADPGGFDQPHNVFDTETVEAVSIVAPSGESVQTLQRSISPKQEVCTSMVRLLWLLPNTCLVLARSLREEGAFERHGLYEETAGPRLPPRMRMRVLETYGGGLRYGETKMI